MSQKEVPTGDCTLSVRNIGGIDHTELSLSPGINVLSGRNATNRTSTLQAIMAALGSTDVSLKGDADAGEVRLEFDDDTYTCNLKRANGTVRFDGEPFLEDPVLAELFAFLLESNEARRAIITDGDLREILLRPVDVDDIERQIDALLDERRGIESSLEEIDDAKAALHRLEERRNDLTERIEETNEELEATREELADIEATESTENDELEEVLDRRSELRTELESVEFEIDTHEESLDALADERDELDSELAGFDEEHREPGSLDADIDRLRKRLQGVEQTVARLQDIVQFNERLLDDGISDVESAFSTDEDGNVTDRLLAENDRVVCWTCGSEVETEQIDEALDTLRSITREKLDSQRDIESQIDELRSTKRTIEERTDRMRSIERRLETIDEEIEDRRERLDSLRDDRDALEESIDSLDSEIKDLEESSTSTEESTYIDLNSRVNELEYTLGRLENERDSVESEIADHESTIEEEPSLSSRREAINDELEELRTYIERIERDAVASFNEHMESILDMLGYSNMERIWIERIETDSNTRGSLDRARFDIHVVRSTEDGATYEDSIEHLSESELEVTALIFALAGYLVHEVYETVPFMLLDSVEAIDSDRIATLVDYLAEFTEFLVVALLPEDSAALGGDVHVIDEI